MNIKTNLDLVDKALDIASLKTVYMWGTFGQLVTDYLIKSKKNQYKEWYTRTKQLYFESLVDRGYFAFDCIGLIKGCLWDWHNGKVQYNINGVPDINANTFITKCNDVSTDFKNIVPGEVVWMKGHIGIYVGDGYVVEATPKWGNGVQRVKMNRRKWLKHGKIPYIKYVSPNTIPDWKLEGLNELSDIMDKEQWIDKLDNFMPTWAILNILSRIRKESKDE